MNFIAIGIDPGKKGCISVIEKFGSQTTFYCEDMPLLPGKGIDSKNIFHYLYKVKEVAKKYSSNIFCVIEKVQSMPRQNSVATLTYGIGDGKLLAVLEILEIPFEEIRPMKWRKFFSIPIRKNKKGKSIDKKELAAKKAIQLYPSLSKEFYTEKGKLIDGRTESLLMAHYCLKNHMISTRTTKIVRRKRNG